MDDVIIYTTPNCPYCNMAKDFLEENKIGYRDVDVSADHDAAREMIKRSGMTGVPQLLIGEKLIIGFDKEAIKETLGL